MAWTNMDLDPDFPSHPKTLRLESMVGIAAITYLVRFWCWAAHFAPTGRLDKYGDVEFLERRVMGWTGDSGELMNALTESGFVVNDDGCMVIHKFAERQRHLIESRERQRYAARVRWEKARQAREPAGRKKPPPGMHAAAIVVGQIKQVWGRDASPVEETWAMTVARRYAKDDDGGRKRILYAFEQSFMAGKPGHAPRYVDAVLENYGKRKPSAFLEPGDLDDGKQTD